MLAKLSVKDAAAAVAAKHGLPRRQVYARALALAGAVGEGRADAADERRRGAHLYGLKAESIAALLLRLKGYRILARRFVVSGGEIDLIAQRGGSIAFVEVKARADMEIAAISISATKRRRIARAARVWLARNPWAAGLPFGATRYSSPQDAFPVTRRPRIGS